VIHEMQAKLTLISSLHSSPRNQTERTDGGMEDEQKTSRPFRKDSTKEYLLLSNPHASMWIILYVFRRDHIHYLDEASHPGLLIRACLMV
jgi:hypothetical protein